MALTVGTFYNSGQIIPAALTYTASVTQDAGGNGFLLVFIANETDSSSSVTGVTYGGQALTLLRKDQSQTQTSDYFYCYYLANSSVTGANNLVVTWNNAQYNKTGITVQAFTGSSGIGANNVTTATSPVTGSLTVSANSVIMGWCFTTGGSSSMTWTGATAKWFNQLDNFNGGSITSSLTAGSQSVTGSPLFSGSMSLMLAEIKQSGGTTLTSKNTQAVWI